MSRRSCNAPAVVPGARGSRVAAWVAGVGMARQTIADDIRAQALADLHAGEQPAVVAQRYGINRDTVNKWKQRFVSVSVDMSPSVSVSTSPIRSPAIEERHITLQELVIENLRAKLVATQRIAEHATNPEWLNKQNAGELATLFGVLDGSAIGILDRLAAAQRPALPDDAER